MRRSNTPWRTHRRLALTGGVVLLLALPACVTRGTYDEVVAERDRVTEERNGLRVQAERLATSQQVLEDERVELLEEVEGLRETQAGLEGEVQRTRRDLAETEDALAAQQRAKAEAVAAADAEVAQLRSSYDALVADLESEVESGRVQLERLRDASGFALPDEVVFAPGSARLTTEGRRLVESLAGHLVDVAQLIEVHGHTDSIPTQGAVAERYPTNWELAGARAASVVRILVDGGVPAERVVAVSHGASWPVAPNDTPEERARNRRIEIRLRPLPAPGTGGVSAPAAP